MFLIFCSMNSCRRHFGCYFNELHLFAYLCLMYFLIRGLYDLLSMQLVTNEGLVEVVLEYYFDLVLATNVAI